MLEWIGEKKKLFLREWKQLQNQRRMGVLGIDNIVEKIAFYV